MVNSRQRSNTLANVSHEIQSGMLVVKLVGRAGVQVLINYVDENLDEFVAHDRLIYDLREWDVDSLTVDSFRNLPESFAPVHERRPSGRAALLIEPHLSELADILIAIYESGELPVQLAYFFEPEPAEDWLRAG